MSKEELYKKRCDLTSFLPAKELLLRNKNQYIKLSTPYSNTVWKIFSIYTIKPEVYYLMTYFKDDEKASRVSFMANDVFYYGYRFSNVRALES